MVTYPHPNNDFALPGSAFKTSIRHDSTVRNTSSSMMDWHLSSSVNTQKEPKYATKDNVSYIAKGTISVEHNSGGLRLTKLTNNTTDPEFAVNPEDSQLFSKATVTTLGSTVIETLDGYLLHPLGLTTPSTPFSPVKGWMSQFFPATLGKGLLTITILELVQGLLLRELSNISANNTVTNTTEKITEKDLGTIIIENEDIFYPNGTV